MILRPTTVRLSRFHWDRDLDQLVAEHSDLGSPAFGRVYDDACDLGLTVFSERTGRSAVYVIDRTETDREGDISSWKLVPADPRDKNLPSVLIWND